MAGYMWLIVLGLIVSGFAILVVRLVVGGKKHPDIRGRALLAWAALVVVVATFSWAFAFPPRSLIAAIGTAALYWPIYRHHLMPRSPAGSAAFAAAAIILAVTACWSAVNWYLLEFRMPPGDCSYLESLRTDLARDDAEQAVSRGAPHLLGVYGFTLEVPGVSDGQTDRAIRPIDCTGNMLVSARHRRLVEAAHTYADRYNRRVLELSGNRVR